MEIFYNSYSLSVRHSTVLILTLIAWQWKPPIQCVFDIEGSTARSHRVWARDKRKSCSRRSRESWLENLITRYVPCWKVFFYEDYLCSLSFYTVWTDWNLIKNTIDSYRNREMTTNEFHKLKIEDTPSLRRLAWITCILGPVIIIQTSLQNNFGSCHYPSSPEFQSFGLATLLWHTWSGVWKCPCSVQFSPK